MFTSVVVAVDGREGGRDALRLGAMLAGAAGSELIAVSAHPFHHRPALRDSPVEEARREQTAMLERELAAQEVTARALVVAGRSPARALRRVAEGVPASLIVVGSTHRGTLGRVLAGDAAQATLDGAPCPVAVAPRGFATAGGAFVRIGVGFDGSDESWRAIELAAGLARRCGARLSVLRVVDTLSAVATEAVYAREWMTDARDEAERELREVVAGLDVPAEGGVVLGGPLEELVGLSGDVDLLVTGSRGWGPVRRILLGGTTSGLVRRAACPVLVVPRGAAMSDPGEKPAGGGHAERAVTT